MRIKLFTIPNLLTLSNLLCGALGAVAALSRGNLTAAFGFMAAAAVFDFFDGFAARLLRQEGPIGGELDSLADDISFGFLPAAVLYVLYGRSAGGLLPEWAGFWSSCLRRARLCGSPSSTSTIRSIPSSAGFRRLPRRFSALRWGCWPSVTGWRFRARRWYSRLGPSGR